MQSSLQDRTKQAWDARETLQFPGFQLSISNLDGGGRQYRADHYRGLAFCPIQAQIAQVLKPQLFIDVGANYGFTSLVHHKVNPSAAIVAIEPDPMLAPFLDLNLRQNGLERFSVVSAICSGSVGTATFGLNPEYSQDNRVNPCAANWVQLPVPSVTLDALLAQADSSIPVLIKIDVQGFEKHVFHGAEEFLGRSNCWMLKTEFAPAWLRSQNTDPVELLRDLLTRYEVGELPQRPRFRFDSLGRMLQDKLQPGDEGAFVEYLENQSNWKKGFCDLLVWPRNLAA